MIINSLWTECSSLKEWVTEQARQVVVNEIKKGNVRASMWWLERRCKQEFSLRYEFDPQKNEQTLESPSFQYIRDLAETMRRPHDTTISGS